MTASNNFPGEDMSMTAEEIAREIAKAPLSIEEKVGWHLANFTVKMPDSLIPVCSQAIRVALAGGNLLTELELPDGVLFQGQSVATVNDIIEGHHLHFYLETQNA